MITSFAGIRRAVGMAALWAVTWAPLGVLIGLIVDADGSMDEPWVAVGAYPGFLSAVVFSVLLGITSGGRGLDERSLTQAGLFGAISGLLVIVLPFTLLGTPNLEHPFYRWRFAIIAGVTVLSSISAVASVMVARMKKRRESVGHTARA